MPAICVRVGSGRLVVSFLSFSAAASGCWLCGAASKMIPRPVIPCTAAVKVARGGGVVSPAGGAGSVLLIVSLSSALAICEPATRENASQRPSRTTARRAFSHNPSYFLSYFFFPTMQRFFIILPPLSFSLYLLCIHARTACSPVVSSPPPPPHPPIPHAHMTSRALMRAAWFARVRRNRLFLLLTLAPLP